MCLAVISDIHGNYKALEAFLEYAKKHSVSGIVCLGDMVTDGPYPERTLSLVQEMRRQYPCYLVRGNREQYLIDNFYGPRGFKPSSASGSLYYTSLHITPEDIRFFESLPVTTVLPEKDWPSARLCHGAPDDLRGNFMEEPQLLPPVMAALKEAYLFGGHSHQQAMKQFGKKTYVNPGSLGLAIDGVGRRAQFAVAGRNREGGFSITFESLSYDAEGYLRDFAGSGLDELGGVLNRAVKRTLCTGINYFFETVREATRLAGKKPMDIPEEVWEQAAEKLGF